MAMDSMFLNLVGERGRADYAFNQWDNTSFRSQLEILAEEHNVKSMLHMGILVQMILSSFKVLPYTATLDEKGIEAVFYQIDAYVLKILAVGSRKISDRKRKIVALSIQLKENADWSHFTFKNCDLTKLHLRGEDFKASDLVSSPHFIFELKRPPTGTKYGIFTKRGYEEYYSHENSPLKVYVEETILPRQLNFMDTCPDQVAFDKIKSKPDDTIGEITQSLKNVDDIYLLRNNLEHFFVSLIPLHKQHTSKWAIGRTASDFIDFCYNVVKFTFELNIHRLDAESLLILLGNDQRYIPVTLQVNNMNKPPMSSLSTQKQLNEHFLSQYLDPMPEKTISIMVNKQAFNENSVGNHFSLAIVASVIDFRVVGSSFMENLVQVSKSYKDNEDTTEIHSIIRKHLEIFKNMINMNFGKQEISSMLIGQLAAMPKTKKFTYSYRDPNMKDVRTLIVYPENSTVAIVLHCADSEVKSDLKIRRVIPKLDDAVDYVIRLNIRSSNHAAPNNAFDKNFLTMNKKTEFLERNGNLVKINDLNNFLLSTLSIQNLTSTSEQNLMIGGAVVSTWDIKSVICGFLMNKFIVQLRDHYILATNRLSKQKFLIDIFSDAVKSMGNLLPEYYLMNDDQLKDVIIAAIVCNETSMFLRVVNPKMHKNDAIEWCLTERRRDPSVDCLDIEYFNMSTRQAHIAKIEKLGRHRQSQSDTVNTTSKVINKLTSAKRLRRRSIDKQLETEEQPTSMQVHKMLNQDVISKEVSVTDLSDLEMIGSSGRITLIIVASARGTAVTLRMMSLIPTSVVLISIVVAFFAVDIFRAVKTVHDMNDILEMSVGEEWALGAMTMFHYVDHDLLKETQDKFLNNQVAGQVKSFLERDQASVNMWFQPRLTVDLRKKAVFLEDNYLNLRRKIRIWSRTWPDTMHGISTVAMDDTNSVLTGEKRHKIGKFAETYQCKNMIGFSNSKSGNSSKIFMNLHNGTDTVLGHLDMPHVFVLGNGEKFIEGGNSNDDFILTGNWTYGTLNGMGGTNMLNITSFSMNRNLVINFDGSYGSVATKYRKTPEIEILNLINITQVIGRPGLVDEVTLSCETNLVHSKGGRSDSEPDHIVLPQRNCSYKSIILLSPHTHVDTMALTGDLFFLVNSRPGKSLVENLAPKSSLNSYFILDVDINDIQEIFFEQIDSTQNIFISVYGNDESEDATEISILNVDTEKVKFFFNDNISLSINEDTVFIQQSTLKEEKQIIQQYPRIAEKLGAVMTIFCNATNSSIIIGHGKSANRHTIHEGTFANVLPNDPDRVTHLVAGSSENIFVFNARHDEMYPKSEDIFIWCIGKHEQQKNSILLLHFAQQLNNAMSLWPKVEVDSEASNENDIVLKITDSNNRNITFAKIILKNAASDNNFQKISLTMKRPMLISKQNGTFKVEPEPMVFDKYENFIVIKESQIEMNTIIRVKSTIGDYKLMKNGENLVLTNAFDMREESQEQLLSLIFEDFFANEKTMKSLVIRFDDQEILLDSVIV